MDTTVPGKSLDAQFDALWRRFERLQSTQDSISTWAQRLRRWLMPVNVSFIVPIEQQSVCDYLRESQDALRSYFHYAPQPADKLHITIYQVGYLRSLPFQRQGAWSRRELDEIALRARALLQFVRPFDVRIGPINAFPNVAIAEVHDLGRLRMLYEIVAQSVPAQLASPLPYPMIPHVTLGYFGKQPAPSVRNAMRRLRTLPSLSFRVDRVDLTLYYPKPAPYELKDVLQHSVEEIIDTIPLSG